jgi:hypothetical protein
MGVRPIPDRRKKGAIEILSLFRDVASSAGWELPQIDRATESTVIDFPAEETDCAECGLSLPVLKTRKRAVVTLSHGHIEAREILRVCKAGGHDSAHVSRSRKLARLVPPFQRYGWDLIVHVGLRRFLFFRQRSEVQEELRKEYGITVSTGTVSALSDRFLERLEALHVSRAPHLREAMKEGYSLHIDSTNDTGRGGLFVCMDGLRGWVLNAGRIASERTEFLVPIVEETIELFGDPIAAVRDMGKACKRALDSLRERGIRDFICHYHFVADIGTDLLERKHDRLKQFLKVAGVTRYLRKFLASVKATTWGGSAASGSNNPLAAFLYWILHGNGSKTLPFPYGLAHLEYYERVRSAPEVAPLWVSRPWSKQTEECMETLGKMLKKLTEEPGFKTTVRELLSAKRLFDELREILRLEKDPSRLRQPLPPKVEANTRVDIEKELNRFVKKLEQRAPSKRRLYDKSPCYLVLDHIRRYRQHLFGHPVIRDENGKVTHVVDRTNNPLESLFSVNKRGIRRRTGRKHLTRDLEDLPPKAVLVENLRNPAYVRIVCGSLENLPDAFANLDTPVIVHSALRPRPDADLRKQVRALCKVFHTTGTIRTAAPSCSTTTAATGS